MHSHFYYPTKSLLSIYCDSKLWDKQQFELIASRSGLAGCSQELTLKRPATIKDMKKKKLW